MRFATSFTRLKYALVLISGFNLGAAGVYAAWLDLNGGCRELGLAFFVWLPLHLPVYLLALNLPRDLYFPIPLPGGFLSEVL